jgi:hypothetical protein
MPAVSPEQQRLMAQAYALKTGKKKKKDLNPEYAEQISKLAKSMTAKQLRDFAKTKHSSMKEGILNFDSFNEGHKEINHKDQKLSKDMKKQGHVSSKKPSNKKISSEDSLAEKPKKGSYREPNSKKLDGENFLAKDHKLAHIKEFGSFNENAEFERVPVKVKDIIEYLQSLDPEMEVFLDKDGWDYYPTGLETVKNSYLFHVSNRDDKYLIINN